jgi:hypothetical protein
MADGVAVRDESDWWTLAPAEVLKLDFPVTPVGRRGLQAEPVERFRRWVVESLERAGMESGALRAEIERLHLYIRQQWQQSDAGQAGTATGAPALTAGRDRGSDWFAGLGTGQATAQAVGQVPAQGGTPIGQALEVLARAQEIADQRIAAAETRMAQAERRIAEAEQLTELAEKRAALARDQARHSVLEADELIAHRWQGAEHEIAARLEEAEQEALDVVARACREYEDILTRAHRRAEHAAERALDECDGPGGGPFVPGRPAPAEAQMKAAYLQTFARVSGAALRATLDVTRQELQRLLPGDDRDTVDLPAVRVLGTGELQVIVTPPAGVTTLSRRGHAEHLKPGGHAEHVRSGALLSGVIRPAVPAS